MTKQQQLVYRVVKASCTHPTAEGVYEQARSEMPSLGIATVYRALERLSKDGSILRIGVDGGPDRYDGTLRFHAHAFCRSCGRVRDVELGDIEQRIRQAAGSCAESVQVSITDLCASCANQSGQSSQND